MDKPFTRARAFPHLVDERYSQVENEAELRCILFIINNVLCNAAVTQHDRQPISLGQGPAFTPVKSANVASSEHDEEIWTRIKRMLFLCVHPTTS
jgi:hypothetical protein